MNELTESQKYMIWVLIKVFALLNKFVEGEIKADNMMRNVVESAIYSLFSQQSKSRVDAAVLIERTNAKALEKMVN